MSIPTRPNKATLLVAVPFLLGWVGLSIVAFPVLYLFHHGFAKQKGAVSREVSQTAIGVAFVRMVGTEFGILSDHLAHLFVPFDLRMIGIVMRPIIWATGMINEGMGSMGYVLARTVFFDEVINKTLRRPDIKTFIILGAGFDNRAYRLHIPDNVTVFEVDIEPTQRHKVKILTNAGVNITHVTFVGVDFSRENFMDKLETNGFDASAPALILWESVSMYLDKGAVSDTLASISKRCAPGSVLAMDFAEDLFDLSRLKNPYGAHRTKAYVIRKGEPFKFGVLDGNCETFLQFFRFETKQHLDAVDLEQRYLTTKDGHHRVSKVVGFIHVVEAVLQPPEKTSHP